MTAHRDLKRRVRERRRKTGESYATARAHVLRRRAELLGAEPAAMPPETAGPGRCDAVVLKVSTRSVRVRAFGADEQVTVRRGSGASGEPYIAPGHIVTLTVSKRWTWRGDAYATGRVENPRIDVRRLGLEPLALHSRGVCDLRRSFEPFRAPDPYAPLWRRLTARPRAEFELDDLAFDLPPYSRRGRESATCDAAEAIEVGDDQRAREILMDVLCEDLRCIDAHAHLGVIEFPRRPECALVHYELGTRIAELSLPEDFDGLLLWGWLANRPYLRCLHGYGLCLWRLGRADEALAVFERTLLLNPPDNQCVRDCRQDLLHGRRWDEVAQDEPALDFA